MADRIRRRRRMMRHFRPERPIADRGDPLFGREEEEIRQRYRFRRDTIIFITGIVRLAIERPTERTGALPAMLQVLITLRFLATGTFQSVVADLARVHQTTVCRTIHRVCRALAAHLNDFVVFPTGRIAREVQRGFHAIAGKELILTY